MSEVLVPVRATLDVGTQGPSSCLSGPQSPPGDMGRAEDLPHPWLRTGLNGTEEEEGLAQSPSHGQR